MQYLFQPEENRIPQTAPLAETNAPPVTEMQTERRAVRHVNKRLKEITRRAKRVRRRFQKGLRVVVPGAIAGYVASVFLLPPNHPLRYPLALLFLFSGYILCGWTLWMAMQMRAKFDVGEITRTGGLKAIVPLFATLRNRLPPEQKRTIYDALTLLLPQVKARHARLLRPAARRIINGWLDMSHDTRFENRYPDALRIAALKALARAGDATALPVVERLTRITPRNDGQAKVQQAAMECLPPLLARCRKVDAAQTLLRASQAERVAPETLLRPASGAGRNDAGDLLRGAEPPDNG